MNKAIRCLQGDKKNPIAKCRCHQFLTMEIKGDFVHIKKTTKITCKHTKLDLNHY